MGGATWVLIHFGKVGVALDPYLAAQWRQRGALLYRAKGEDIRDRMMGVSIPGRGWRPGMLLIPVYAPLTGRSSLAHRDNFREQLSSLLDKASTRFKPILGGDFNGEVGPSKDQDWTHVLGPYGDSRRTKGGEELLHFCEQEGLIVANTFSPQQRKCTWFHFQGGTEHALDHFLVKTEDKRWARKAITLHFSSSSAPSPSPTLGRPSEYASVSWLAFTDHNPIEMEWKIGKDWTLLKPHPNNPCSRPDVLRMLGSSIEAKTLRSKYSEAVTNALSCLDGSSLNWDAVADVMKTCALRILGPVPPRHPLPWLKGKEREIKELSNQVHLAELNLKQARLSNANDLDQLLQARRTASRSLSKQKQRWEAQWWDDLADKAQQAGDANDEFTFWQVCKTLGFRDTRTFHQVAKSTVPQPELEREAWKAFLADIQKDAGNVHPSVWEHVPESSSLATELSLPPSRKEFNLALSKMHLGRRGGIDDVTVELIKFGGLPLQDQVFTIISNMWSEACMAEQGKEADSWSSDTTTGICIPVFKNKGDKADRKNFRNLVMLSVAAKLIARIAATRLSLWAEQHLSEEQTRFRKHRGIDDAHQLSRRIIEEVVVSQHDYTVAVTSFDIIRAYTRVCRHALWSLLKRLGIPDDFLQVLKALHEHTRFMVFVHNGYSSPWFTERGLREGCPSSPILFNLFHTFIMNTFRSRRSAASQELSMTPGLPWEYKVDGRVSRTGKSKTSSRVLQVCLGDVEYADDTQIFGFHEEVSIAETLFTQTLQDWEQLENLDKREKIILCSGGRNKVETLHQFEQRTIKHLGAFLNDSGDYWPDTKKRVQAGFFAVRRVARLWSLGTPRGRGSHKGLTQARKLKVMRAVLEGTVLACGKTRVWNKVQELKAQQVLSRGIRRALGVDRHNMREFGYSDEGLRLLANWDSFETLLHRNVLRWVGHVARMPISRLPKIALFGWPQKMTKHTSGRFTYPMWIKWLLQKHGISHMDWFRLAQKPTSQWLSILNTKLPRSKPSSEQVLVINQWKPGDDLPSPPTPIPDPPLVFEPCSDDDLEPVDNCWSCPACPFLASSAKGLQSHYDNTHAPSDPSVTTMFKSTCPTCSQVFLPERIQASQMPCALSSR